ncbi:MAG: hypothetical protein BVN35_05640 [Proteobacteria bacterium ST_bin11]|nr:MAG: hypothetical protein BVN35_05640 [Proteobacteria bacterium ST_bin11]
MLSKILITLVLSTFCTAAAAQDFYVSPSGSDRFNGLSPRSNLWTNTGPFRTLARAQQAIRSLKAAGRFNKAITVHVGRGTYQLQTAMVFDSRDSGLPGQEILWQGEKDATLISGGIELKSCQQYDSANPNQILSCQLNPSVLANISPDVNKRILGNGPVFELFVNESRMQPARWPNYNWAYVRTPIETKTQFNVFQTIPNFSGDLSDAQVHIYPGDDIYDQYIGVSALDIPNKKITLSNPTQYTLAAGRRFYLQNIESAIDIPGEWHFDKVNNRVLFIPLNEIPAKPVISAAKNILIIKDASHITFRNLKLQYSTSHAIRVDRTDSVWMDNLEISNVAGKAIWAPMNTNMSITNSYLHDIGQGGMFVSGGDRPTLKASNNLIENNRITNYDKILYNWSPAIEMNGVAITVSHNKIENGNGKAIVLTGNDHIIEKNEISQICQQTDDCGAIYSGRDWTFRGNIVRYNYIHDFYGYRLLNLDIAKNIIQYTYDGARGIYLDDRVSGFNVFSNIVVNTGQIGIQVGGGRDTTIENNVIRTGRFAILFDNRKNADATNVKNSLNTMPINSAIWKTKYPELSKPIINDRWPEGNKITRNVVISNRFFGGVLLYFMPIQTNIISNNLVWNPSRPLTVDSDALDSPLGKNSYNWTDWISKGIEKNSLFANPCMDTSAGKITITCANSPVNAIGFKSIPTDIGLIN